MKNLSIRLKLVLATLPSLIILIVAVVIFSSQLNQTIANSKELYFTKLYGINSNLVSADRDFYQALQASTKLFTMNGKMTADDEKKAVEDYNENAKQVADKTGEAIELAKTDDELWTEIKSEDGKSFKELSEEFEKNFAEWESSYKVGSETIGEAQFEKHAEAFSDARDCIDAMEDITETWAERASEGFVSSIRSITITLMIVFAVIAVLMTVWVLFLMKYIGNGIRVVSNRLIKLSEYDLSEDPIKVDSKDEIGRMKKALNDTEEALENIVGTLKSTSNGLNDASDVVSKGTESTGIGVDNVSSAADELANASTAMAQDVSDISQNMTELSNIMERSVDSARSLADASTKIGEVTESGNEVVEELAGINEKSFVEFNAIFEAIDEIKKSGEKISEASELILNIADQTNLLSLNASIEAARAGEAGKGFAVVADEIRNLSDESKENVDTINEILSELTVATNNAATKADVVKEFVQKQNDAVGQTKESFDAIVTTVEGVEAAINDLEQINEELDVKSREIGESVSNLSALSEENAATSEQLSATAQTVQTNVEDLKVTQGDVKSSSGNLSDIVGRFILAPEDEVEAQQEEQ